MHSFDSGTIASQVSNNGRMKKSMKPTYKQQYSVSMRMHP